MSKPVRAVPASAGVPEPGTPGRLRTRLRDKVMVRIARRRDDQLLLVPLTLSEEELDELEQEPILLECTSPRGLLCLRGEAQLLESGMIEFRVVDGPEVLQRRRFVRVPAPQPVTIVGHGGERITTHAVNLSGGGMLLGGLDRLKLGDRVVFRIDLGADEPPVEGWGRVVRAGRRGDRALEFEEISKQQRERLIHFIFGRQRAALRVIRDVS
jgi:hypothetical protein